jgi:hypothetical protein
MVGVFGEKKRIWGGQASEGNFLFRFPFYLGILAILLLCTVFYCFEYSRRGGPISIKIFAEF